MEKFVKLFELDNGAKFLVVKRFDDNESDGEPNKLIITTDIDGMVLNIIVGFKDEDKMDETFKNFDQIMAEEQYSKYWKALNEQVD